MFLQLQTITNYTAQKGNNEVIVDLGNVNAGGLYIVNIASDSQSFKPAKVLVSGK